MKCLDRLYFPTENASFIYLFIAPALPGSCFYMVLTHVAGSMRLPVRGISVGGVDSCSASGLSLLQKYLTSSVFSQTNEMTVFCASWKITQQVSLPLFKALQLQGEEEADKTMVVTSDQGVQMGSTS